jgi:hypothetical protein
VLSDKNPWWPVMPDLASYLQRVSYILRQGDLVADVALYAPNEDAWSTFKPGTPRYLNLFTSTVDWVGPNIIPAILDSGNNFDLIDDGTLKEAQVRRYKAIVLPGVRFMPESTRRWLADYAKNGGTVLAVRRKPDGESPSLEVVDETELARRLAAAAPPDVVLNPAVPEIGFVHRRLPDSDVYFLANTGNVPRTVKARFSAPATNAELWDPMSGKTERLVTSGGEVALQFEPYGSRVVVLRKTAGTAPLAQSRSEVASEDISSGWNVSLGGSQGGGSQAGSSHGGGTISLPHSWIGQTATRNFSGTATYQRTLQLPVAIRQPGAHIFLDFGEAKPSAPEPLPGGTIRGNSFAALVAPPIREAATVFVNGKRAGSLWAPPYRLDITELVRDGANDIRIDVYNTAINQLAEGGRLPNVQALVERYGRRFRLQDLDELKPLPSGIMSPVRLVAEK